jgi:amino acid permease
LFAANHRPQFIVISGVIGSGVFSNNGTALEVAGPAGLIISLVVMAFITLGVGESIGELVQKFPCYNAIVEYVRVFVDPDLGVVIGIAYCKLRIPLFKNLYALTAKFNEKGTPMPQSLPTRT